MQTYFSYYEGSLRVMIPLKHDYYSMMTQSIMLKEICYELLRKKGNILLIISLPVCKNIKCLTFFTLLTWNSIKVKNNE